MTTDPICDSCHKTFAPILKQKPLRGGGAERFFKCPHCAAHYHVATYTATGVKLLGEIQQARQANDLGLLSELVGKLQAEVAQ